MYIYNVYGLIVYSDIPLYNIPETTGKPDIFILLNSILRKDTMCASDDFYYSTMYVYFQTAFSEFEISNGDKITVSPLANATNFQLTAYIIGWGFAFLFTQRGFSALHGTALHINGQGLLISGASGVGKSTIALSLIQKGYSYLADDVVMINPEISMKITPAYPIQKLCSNTINMSVNRSNLLYINESKDKYSYFNEKNYCSIPQELKVIIILIRADVSSVHIEEITGLNRYLRTLECLFLAQIYSFKGTPSGDKFRCLVLAGAIRLFVITRPINGDTVNDIVDKVNGIMNNIREGN